MLMLEKIKYYYEKGFYQITHLDKFLDVGAITEKEYKEIIGDE